jgi:hypothetical protein
MGMSEEQRKDLKFKVIAATILFTVLGSIYMIGPGLESVVLKRARANRDKPWAKKHVYYVGRIYEATFRDNKAKEVYEKDFYPYYCGDEEQIDAFYEVQEDTGIWADEYLYFLPWVASTYTEENRPKPLSVKPDEEFFPEVLLQLAKIYEGEKLYQQSDHVFYCVKRVWPNNADLQERADKAIKRRAQRSY